METTRKKRRQALRRFLWMIAGALVFVGSLPVWFPWVLKPLARFYGLDYAQYDRLGYTQFAVDQVSGRSPGLDFKARRAECVLPTTWLWRKCLGATNATRYLRVQESQFIIARTAAETSRGSLD